MLPDSDYDPSGNVLLALLTYFSSISLTAVGGGIIMLAPDVHRYVVDVRHWLTGDQFAAAFAIAQASPGPNLLYVTLVGLQVAGIAGALIATAAIALPTLCLTLAVVRFIPQGPPGRLGYAIRNGVAPISVGLLAAGGLVLARAADTNAIEILLTVASIWAASMTKLNPVWLIGVGALAGAAFKL
jgi:chromate transporter